MSKNYVFYTTLAWGTWGISKGSGIMHEVRGLSHLSENLWGTMGDSPSQSLKRSAWDTSTHVGVRFVGSPGWISPPKSPKSPTQKSEGALRQ
jgi:hypothetical protein